MKSFSKIQLLQKFFRGNISDQELKSLFIWLNSEKGNQDYNEMSNDKWLSNDFETIKDIDSEILFSGIEAKIKDKKGIIRKQLWVKFRNAAAIFILGLILPLSYFIAVNPQLNTKQVYYKESFSNEKIREITLPDGTNVWLMAGSTISYPSSFSGTKTRNVEVKGQAFFDVAKDASHPFVLDLGKVGVKVLGTSFNVMNYDDEDYIEVVLKTGKVDLFETKKSGAKVLSMIPGQKGVFSKNKSEFLLDKVNVENYTSWIGGKLIFNNEPLAVVLKNMGRWYNIDIAIDNPKVQDYPFTLTIKKENLDQIIDLLKYSTPFKYDISKVDGETKLVIK